MTPSTPATQGARAFVKNLKTCWRLWIVPTVVVTALAAAYAAIRPAVWEASQALVVREEALGAVNRQGRFDSAEAMKTTQETVLEIARNHRVVAAALAEVGPPAGRIPSEWPTERDVEEMREQIAVKAPTGAEFGRTEVIYLTVRRQDRDAAGATIRAICHQLEVFWQGLRNVKAQSMIDELAKTAAVQQADLDASTRQLEQMEKAIGSDLGELRSLNEQGAGSSNLRSAMNTIQEELRRAVAARDSRLQQRALLTAALHSPENLVATPGHLLDSQPALKRLKDGLVDAQLRKAEVMGKMSADHPHVKTAVLAEMQVRKDLHDELQVALRGVEADLNVNDSQVRALQQQLAEVRARLDRLAGIRARYTNQVADVRRNTEIIERAQKALADARAARGAAQSTSLLTRLDDPLTGSRPVGPRAIAILAAGLLGGLATGLGLVFLVTPMGCLHGRRWSDCLPGRRATDRSVPGGTAPVPGNRPSQGAPAEGRRAADRPIEAAPPMDLARSGRRATDLHR